MNRRPVIRVTGARTNNLNSVDVEIPKGQLVVVTGVSGSGKSSLAFDTIAAESQRLLNETYPSFIQNLMPHLPRPDVDTIEGLSASIVVDQAALGANPRSTVGTATDAWSLLRQLFSLHGTPRPQSPRHLSFNDPAGMCLACEGTGREATVDIEAILDHDKSLNEGAITFPTSASGRCSGRSTHGRATSTTTNRSATTQLPTLSTCSPAPAPASTPAPTPWPTKAS